MGLCQMLTRKNGQDRIPEWPSPVLTSRASLRRDCCWGIGTKPCCFPRHISHMKQNLITVSRASGRRVEAKNLPQEVREASFPPTGTREKGAASGRRVEAKPIFPWGKGRKVRGPKQVYSRVYSGARDGKTSPAREPPYTWQDSAATDGTDRKADRSP